MLAIVARMHPHRVRDPPLDAEAPPRKLKTSLELPTDLLIGLMLCCLVRAGGMAKLFCDALCSRSLASPVPPPLADHHTGEHSLDQGTLSGSAAIDASLQGPVIRAFGAGDQAFGTGDRAFRGR